MQKSKNQPFNYHSQSKKTSQYLNEKKHKQRQNLSSSSSQRSRHKRKRKENHRQHKKHRQQPEQEQELWQTQKKEQMIQQNKKQLPCFQPSGILLQFYNSRQGVSLKFFQPPQSRSPNQSWRIYVFKGEQVFKPIILQKSAYLIGKDQKIADILCQNPSISRQHAVIQFRLVNKNYRLQNENNNQVNQKIEPYIMDLQSTNGTFLNDQKIQSGRYYQLLHKDVLKFGFSQREYVIVKWENENLQEQK